MSVVQFKIWSDLWHNKSRTLQVVLIVAMGAFAIGMIVGSSDLMRTQLTEIWQQSSPSVINLATSPAVGDASIEALRRVPGVQDVEGALETSIEWRHGPDEPWQTATLLARADYTDQKYARLALKSGDWPQRKTFAVVQGADRYFGIEQNDPLQIRVDGKIYSVPVSGIVYNPLGNPPAFGGTAEFYTTRERFGQLTGERDFNRIFAGVPRFEQTSATNAANEIERRLEKLDIQAAGLPFPERVTSPEKHALQDVLDGIYLILGIMATLTLLLGLLLVFNTINAIVHQQVNQIGIMKAIGARTRQILGVYLQMVLGYGLLSLLVAVPLGALGAYGLTSFLLSSFNIVPGPFTISTTAVLVQVAICLLAPLLISLIPIFNGVTITVREAISSYGLGTKAGLLTRWLAGLQRLPRILVLMISNTFRNKGRVVLTQLTLVGSGLIFMMVMSTQDSVAFTFREVLFDILQYNVSLQFEDPERFDQVEPMALAHPQVEAVEMWAVEQGALRPLGQPESNDDETAIVWGVPLPTDLYSPQVRAGRWLQPGDQNAIVLNQTLAQDLGVGIGDAVTLDQQIYGESGWTVVGLLFDPIIPNSAYMSRAMLLEQTRSVGEAQTVWIKTTRDDPATELAVARDMRQIFNARKLDVSPQGVFPNDTATALADQIMQNFSVILALLATVAVIMGVVGAITLSGVLSLSVMERTREIGVMRAIGATSRTIATLFVGEGLTMGWLSWLIAWPLSIPAGYGFNLALGLALQNEIIYTYTPTGPLVWLAIVTGLSIIASWLPARSATRISVRESLAYQ